MLRTLPFVVVLLAGSGCKQELKIDPTQLPKLNLSSLPRAPDGQAILIQASQARLELDPTARDPITAVAACADLITYCVAPPDRTLDRCIQAVPLCASARPWEETLPCCPGACVAAYRSARTAGQVDLAAFSAVFFDDPGCFPGVQGALEGQP